MIKILTALLTARIELHLKPLPDNYLGIELRKDVTKHGTIVCCSKISKEILYDVEPQIAQMALEKIILEGITKMQEIENDPDTKSQSNPASGG